VQTDNGSEYSGLERKTKRDRGFTRNHGRREWGYNRKRVDKDELWKIGSTGVDKELFSNVPGSGRFEMCQGPNCIAGSHKDLQGVFLTQSLFRDVSPVASRIA
jgi:hypothetical protein